MIEPPMSRPQEGFVRANVPAPATPARTHPRATSRQALVRLISTTLSRSTACSRCRRRLASRPQKSVPATGPLASFAVTRDGDIAPDSRNEAHTLFDHRVQPSARSIPWDLKERRTAELGPRRDVAIRLNATGATCVQGWRARGFHD